MYIFILYFHTW